MVSNVERCREQRFMFAFEKYNQDLKKNKILYLLIGAALSSEMKGSWSTTATNFCFEKPWLLNKTGTSLCDYMDSCFQVFLRSPFEFGLMEEEKYLTSFQMFLQYRSLFSPETEWASEIYKCFLVIYYIISSCSILYHVLWFYSVTSYSTYSRPLGTEKHLQLTRSNVILHGGLCEFFHT